MIIDTTEPMNTDRLECDIAIIGSGPAGVPLALSLARKGLQVVLAEAGGWKSNKSSQEYFAGHVDGQRNHSLTEMRQRSLGGTSATWGGRCVPLDPIDFERRTYVDNSGWPVDYQEIAAWYADALEWCDAGRNVFSAREAGIPPMIEGFPEGDVITDRLERWSPPTHFGRDFLEEFKQLPNLRLLLNAPCTDIRLNSDQSGVEHLRLTAGQNIVLKARDYVLCAGGLENPRLLLNANSQKAAGVGNDHDQVGRYYMGHLTGSIAEIRLNDNHGKVCMDYAKDSDVYVRTRLALGDEAQRREHLLNFCGLPGFPLIGDPSHHSGLLSAIYFAKYFGGMGAQIPQTIIGPDGFPARASGIIAGHLKNMITDLPNVLHYLPPFLIKRFFHKRRMPSMIPPMRHNRYPLHYLAEQTPNPESRVTLTSEEDDLGMRQIGVDFEVANGDAEKVLHCHDTINTWLKQTGAGELRYVFDDPLASIVDQYHSADGHFIGTTRMGDDPHSSVVDRDCCVHGIDNLFVAGSSVFPTSGQANPTLTIVAMALRTADHLLNRQ